MFETDCKKSDEKKSENKVIERLNWSLISKL